MNIFEKVFEDPTISISDILTVGKFQTVTDISQEIYREMFNYSPWLTDNTKVDRLTIGEVIR